jgi:Putative Ig domain
MKKYLVLCLLGLVCSSQLFAAPPQNDNFENAIELPSANIVEVRGRNIEATAEAFESSLNGFSISAYNSVWYKWVPPLTRSTAINVLPFFDSTLTIYQIVDGEPVLLQYDDDGGDGLSSKIVRTVTAGETYYLKVDSYAGSVQGAFRLEIEQAATVSNQFAQRLEFNVRNFTAVGNNASYNDEVNEPLHGSRVKVARRSAWISWTAPSRSLVTVDTTGSRFDTTLAGYAGDTLPTLIRIGQDDNSIRPNLSRFTFTADAGAKYSFAIDANYLKGGLFNINLASIPVPPLVKITPSSLTIVQGDGFILTGSTATSGLPLYSWQRLRFGSNTWENIADDGLFTGALNNTLSVNAAVIDMNGDRFRLAVKDDIGTGYSPVMTLTVSEFQPLVTALLETFKFDLKVGSVLPAPSNGGAYFATGLPAGLTLNPVTGIISGLLPTTTKTGTYRVVYGSTNGNVPNSRQYVVHIQVGGFTPSLSGRFETLLHSTVSPFAPVAKVALAVTSTGRFSGSLYTINDAKSYSFKGDLVLALDAASGSSAIPRIATPVLRSPAVGLAIPRAKGLAPLTLTFSLNEPNPLAVDGVSSFVANLTATPTATSLPTPELPAVSDKGRQLTVYSASNPAPWFGPYTAKFGQTLKLVSSDTRASPEGSGYAIANVAKTGVIALKGHLADGTIYTASAPVASNSQYFLASRLYKAPYGSVAGRIQLEPIVKLVGLVNVTTYRSRIESANDLYWVKSLSSKDKGYLAGFGPVSMNVVMSPWVAPVNDLPIRIGYKSGDGGNIDSQGRGDSTLKLFQAEIDNSGTNLRKLPVKFKISPTGGFLQTDSDLGNANFNIKLDSNTGLFTGTFTVYDQPIPPSVVIPPARMATFKGVLLQDPDTAAINELFGSGYFLIETPASIIQKSTLSGLIEFRIDDEDSHL